MAGAGVLLDGLPVPCPASESSTAEDILTDKRSRLSTDNVEKLLILILKENLLKFWTGCDIEQCEFDGLVMTWLSGMIDD